MTSREERYEWIDKKFSEFAKILKTTFIPDNQLDLAAHFLFERIKIFALSTKHHGFSEEREWRIAYSGEYDKEKYLESMLCYTSGKKGLEPKLKFKVQPIRSPSQI